jgi:hypothetical protein
LDLNNQCQNQIKLLNNNLTNKPNYKIVINNNNNSNPNNPNNYNKVLRIGVKNKSNYILTIIIIIEIKNNNNSNNNNN